MSSFLTRKPLAAALVWKFNLCWTFCLARVGEPAGDFDAARERLPFAPDCGERFGSSDPPRRPERGVKKPLAPCEGLGARPWASSGAAGVPGVGRSRAPLSILAVSGFVLVGCSPQ
eukprot:12125006-Heterocapsa_arctica.AAC.1